MRDTIKNTSLAALWGIVFGLVLATGLVNCTASESQAFESTAKQFADRIAQCVMTQPEAKALAAQQTVLPDAGAVDAGPM